MGSVGLALAVREAVALTGLARRALPRLPPNPDRAGCWALQKAATESAASSARSAQAFLSKAVASAGILPSGARGSGGRSGPVAGVSGLECAICSSGCLVSAEVQCRQCTAVGKGFADVIGCPEAGRGLVNEAPVAALGVRVAPLCRGRWALWRRGKQGFPSCQSGLEALGLAEASAGRRQAGQAAHRDRSPALEAWAGSAGHVAGAVGGSADVG